MFVCLFAKWHRSIYRATTGPASSIICRLRCSRGADSVTDQSIDVTGEMTCVYPTLKMLHMYTL
jgi:hypothetical protein